MRYLLPGDVSAAACVLVLLPDHARSDALNMLRREADLADTFRKRTGHLHPLWGNGSLMSVALAYPHAPEPYLDDPDYAACMALVFETQAVIAPSSCQKYSRRRP